MSRRRRKPSEKPIRYPNWLAPALLSLGAALAATGAYWLAIDYVSAYTGDRGVSSGGGVVLLVAALPLFLGELFRRGTWSVVAGTSTTPASNIVRVRQLALPVTLAWLVVAVLGWVCLVAAPVALAVNGVAFAEAGESVVWLVGLVAVLSSVTTGTMVASLIGRASHARARARGLVAPEERRRRWRNIAGQSFPHLFLTATGFASLGLTPLLPLLASVEGRDLDATALAVMLMIGIVFIASGSLIAAHVWRSGEGPGYLVNSGEGDVSLNFGS